MAALSCPLTKGKEEFWDATADYNQRWSFPACGINLDMTSSAKGGPKVVRNIVAVAPSKLATSTGIHVGSSEDEVLTAYGPFLDRESTPTRQDDRRRLDLWRIDRQHHQRQGE